VGTPPALAVVCAGPREVADAGALLGPGRGVPRTDGLHVSRGTPTEPDGGGAGAEMNRGGGGRLRVAACVWVRVLGPMVHLVGTVGRCTGATPGSAFHVKQRCSERRVASDSCTRGRAQAVCKCRFTRGGASAWWGAVPRETWPGTAGAFHGTRVLNAVAPSSGQLGGAFTSHLLPDVRRST